MSTNDWLSKRRDECIDAMTYAGNSEKEIQQFKAGFDAALEALRPRIQEQEKALELALSFAPKGPVPKGLGPEFYHTLNYEDECKLQERIDKARKALGRKAGE